MIFALAHADLVARQLRQGPSRRGRLAPLVLLGTALIVDVVSQRHATLGAQTVAACVAGLLGGPIAGLIVGAGSMMLAVALPGSSTIGGASMVAAGLAGGLVRRSGPGSAGRPSTGFALGLVASAVRQALDAASASPIVEDSRAAWWTLIALANGVGVALVLAVVEQVRAREAEARAAAAAEIRALQSRMNPHFLFNALNTVAALATIDPSAIPAVVGRLGRFLRWSLEQQDRPLVTLREELGIVRAYLEVEALRFGDRLAVEERVAAEALEVLVPPLSLQPIVENAVLHGIQPLPGGGTVRVTAALDGPWLVLVVSDSGLGFPEGGLDDFLEDRADAHALSILRRRLRGLYDAGAALQVLSRPGEGTTVEVRIPLDQGPAGRRGDPPPGRAPASAAGEVSVTR